MPIKKTETCWLRLSTETLAEAKHYPSIRAAVDTFDRLARRSKEPLTGALHIVTSKAEKPREWPNRLLQLTPDGVLRQRRL